MTYSHIGYFSINCFSISCARPKIGGLHRSMWSWLQDHLRCCWLQRIIFDVLKRGDWFGLGWPTSSMAEEQIASSDEAKSQKYSKDDSKDTTRCQPVPNRQVSRNIKKGTRWMNSLRRFRLQWRSRENLGIINSQCQRRIIPGFGC